MEEIEINNIEVKPEVKRDTDLIIGEAKRYEVKSQENYEHVATIIKACQEQIKKVRSFFEPTIESFKVAKQEAEASRKKLTDRMEMHLEPINNALTMLRDKCKAYENEQKRIADEKAKALKIEEEKKAEEKRLSLLNQAEKKQNEGDEEVAGKLLDLAVDTTAKEVKVKPEIEKVVGLGIRRTWKWKITNEAIIPRKYYVLNEVMINKEVVANKEKTSILGIEAYLD